MRKRGAELAWRMLEAAWIWGVGSLGFGMEFLPGAVQVAEDFILRAR